MNESIFFRRIREPPLEPLAQRRRRVRGGRPPAGADMHHHPSSSSSPAAASSLPLSPADGFLRGNTVTVPANLPPRSSSGVRACFWDGSCSEGRRGRDDQVRRHEPSVGLYFVQQHARASMPILLDVKGKLVEKTPHVALHTEDMEDSICAVRSMADFGLPLADDVIKDINRSLQIMSKAQPKRGLILNPSWGFQSGKNSGAWDELGASNGSSSRNYLSSMFNTAKQKASSLRWPQPDFTTKDDSSENSGSAAAALESSRAGGQGASTPDTDKDEFPIPSRLSDVQQPLTIACLLLTSPRQQRLTISSKKNKN